jgi:Tfp pilus assembly protein PilN
MPASINLARRPFRNERLPWLMAGFLMLGAFVLSLVHGRFISRLLSGDEARTVRLVREDEARIAELEAYLAKEPPLKIESSELSRVRAFKELVDRRVFPWGRLLSELENTLADNVRLSRITPNSTRGVRGMLIDLDGRARTKEAVFSFAEALDRSPLFSNASLKSILEQDDGIEFTMHVVFDPDTPSPPSPPASRSSEDAGSTATGIASPTVSPPAARRTR